MLHVFHHSVKCELCQSREFHDVVNDPGTSSGSEVIPVRDAAFYSVQCAFSRYIFNSNGLSVGAPGNFSVSKVRSNTC